MISPTISITIPVIKNVNPASVPGSRRILLSPSSFKVSTTPKIRISIICMLNFQYSLNELWIRKRNFKLFKLKLPEQSNPPKYTHDSMFGGPDWSLGS